MKVLIFGGTTEGRRLSTALSKDGIDVTLSVATDFGRDVAASDRVAVISNRLDEKAMIALLRNGAFDYVIDATHPYAVLASRNISSACQAAGLKHLRLKRPESAAAPGVIYAHDTAAAAEMLKGSNEKVLLTIGSKELEPFTSVENYAERFFVRILPMRESLKKAFDLGFRGSNIICMQGPFDKEINTATLKMTGAKFLVTKDSGDAGGFEAKVSAALSLGCEVIVIARPEADPVQEKTYTLNELMEVFNIKEIQEELPKQTAFFPLFVDISGRKSLVIGGGKVAERRVKILASFGTEITVISPAATEYIKFAASQGKLRYIERKYQNGDITGLKPFLVIAATDDRQVNHAAMKEATSLDIKVSVADCRAECTCCFPAIAESGSYIAAIVSKNGDHAGVKRTAQKIRMLLNT